MECGGEDGRGYGDGFEDHLGGRFSREMIIWLFEDSKSI